MHRREKRKTTRLGAEQSEVGNLWTGLDELSIMFGVVVVRSRKGVW